MSDSIRIKSTKKPRDLPKPKRYKAKGKSHSVKGTSITSPEQEHKYQMIKLIRSGRSMREASALVRSAAVGLTPEYAKAKDVRDLASLEGGLHSIAKTRYDAKQLAKIKFAPRRDIVGTREEHLATWLANQALGTKVNWTRDGNLVRRGKPNPSRPGSSKGKIGKTRVQGAREVMRDMDKLVKTLQNLQAKHGRSDMRALKKAFGAIRKEASAL